MTAPIIALIIVLALLLICVIAVVSIYNGIITKRNRVDNAWQNIEANLQRRADLIPNLVETVKGYAKHEKGIFETVAEARNASIAAKTPHEAEAADNALTGALRQLFAVAEAYPDLKANSNFASLQEQLSDTENRLVYARQSFNDCVMTYNTAIQTFPGNIVSGIAHFEPKDGYHVESPSDKEVPKVEF